MVRPVGQAQHARMQYTQEQSLPDACLHLVYDATQRNAYGEVEAVWIPGEVFPCGLETLDTRKAREDQGLTSAVLTEARLRLPLTADGVVLPADRVRILSRSGELLVREIEFGIDGEPLRGPTGIVAQLKAATL